MPQKKPPRDLTDEQLADEYAELEQIPQETRTPEEQERFELLRTAVEGRPELFERFARYARDCERLEQEYARYPDLPAKVLPAELERLDIRDLEALLQEAASRFKDRKAYRASIPADDWVGQLRCDKAEQTLEKIRRDVQGELARQRLIAGESLSAVVEEEPKIATAAAAVDTSTKPSEPSKPKESPLADRRRKTRSGFRQQVLGYLIDNREASAKDVCVWCDEQGIEGPKSWYPGGVGAGSERQLRVIHRQDGVIRNRIDKYVSDLKRYIRERP